MNSERHRPRNSLTIGLALLAVVAVALLVWRLAQVFILLFAAIIVAAILYRVAQVTERHTPLNTLWSRVVSWALLAIIAIGFLALLGAQFWSQAVSLSRSVPTLLMDLGDMVGIENLPTVVSDQIEGFFNSPGIFGDIAATTTALFGMLGTLVLVTFGGIFLAVDPTLYRNGVAALFPAPWQERVSSALDTAAAALSGWLIGKIIAMAVIGVVTTLGLMLIGVPSALALGVLAGLLEFIPLIGPILSAVPALLVAVSEGIDTLLWVLALYVALQQVESNVLVPVVQQKTAELPPVVGLFSIVAFGSLFGFAGVVVAAPLTIVIIALTRQLYVRDILGRDRASEEEASG